MPNYKPNLYFDNAAATPLGKAARRSLEELGEMDFVNPSGLSLASKKNREMLNEARHKIAQVVGAQQNQIFFTASATESNFVAINGFINKYPEAVIITSSVEHEAVLQNIPAESKHITIQVDKKSNLNLDQLKLAVSENADKSIFISIMFANNETGALLDLASVRDIIVEAREKRNKNLPIVLHVDAAQAMNFCEIQVDRLGVDALTLSSSKTYGPRGVAALYIRNYDLNFAGVVLGGGQEKGLRSGTENLVGAKAFAAALVEAHEKRKSEFARVFELKSKLVSFLEKECSEFVEITNIKKQLAGNIHFRLKKHLAEDFVMTMDIKHGIVLGTGSACQASSDAPSHVLTSMGWTFDESDRAVRISVGRYNDAEGVDSLIDAMREYLSV
jgi:cysteine desulfurase